MKQNEIITGSLTFVCMVVFSLGAGVNVLNNNGDQFSLFIAFLTVFGAPFFISGIKNDTDRDIFYYDLFIGAGGALFTGVTLIFGTYEGMAMLSSFTIFVIFIIKLTWKKRSANHL